MCEVIERVVSMGLAVTLSSHRLLSLSAAEQPAAVGASGDWSAH